MQFVQLRLEAVVDDNLVYLWMVGFVANGMKVEDMRAALGSHPHFL